MKYRSFSVLFLLFIIFSCETLSTKDVERDNPYPFVVRAILKQGGNSIKFEDKNARMICDKLPTYEECNIECHYELVDSTYECVWDSDIEHNADSCMCLGKYHLITEQGLEIIISDPKKARYPSTFYTGIDVEILYMNKPLNGRVMLTKSELMTTIDRYNDPPIDLTDSYFIDISGGFEATDGVISLSSGIFYSVKPDRR